MRNIMFDVKNAYQIIRHLSVDIGPRLSGSPNCLQAAEYIEKYFNKLNLELSSQSFEVKTGIIDSYQMELLEPVQCKIPCRPMIFSKDTPAEGLIGEIYYVEDLGMIRPGSQPDYGIMLIPQSTLYANLNPDKLFSCKPSAIVIISADPGFKPRHDLALDFVFGQYPPIPIFRISWEDGYRLAKMDTAKVKLTLKSAITTGLGRNIIGELKGKEKPDEIITITGHYDSPPDTPSATDNASGTAVMMELARVYALKGCKRTLRFIALDAEESGYGGSSTYVKQLHKAHQAYSEQKGNTAGGEKSALEKHLLNINMDVLGLALGDHACYVLGPGELSTTMKILAKELGIAQKIVLDSLYGSDHELFAWVGIPAMNFSRVGASMSYIHTPDDTVDLIKLEKLTETGTLIETFLDRYASSATIWPFDREIPAEQAGMVKAKIEMLRQIKLDD